MHEKRVNDLRANAKKMRAWMGIPLILAVLFALCLATTAQENSAWSLHQKGLVLMENDNYRDALIAFDKAIEIDPENASIWMGKGDVLVRMGNYNESLKIYENALETADKTTQNNPHDARGWLVKGELFIRVFKNDEAINAYSKAIELNPTYVEAWYLKGAALNLKAGGLSEQESIKTYEEALTALNKAIELDPGYGKSWSEKGFTLSCLASFNNDLGMCNDSLNAFDKAIKQIPADDTENLALAWGGKSIALALMGNALTDLNRQEEAKDKYEEAVAACDKTIELDQSFVGLQAQVNKASILPDLGRYNESLAAYDEALRLAPVDMAAFNATIMADKGSVLVKMGAYDEALKTFDHALKIDPTSVRAWSGKGDALNKTGRYDEAIKAYDKAIELCPELGHQMKAYAWHSKGNALKALGRYGDADIAYANAKELGYKE